MWRYNYFKNIYTTWKKVIRRVWEKAIRRVDALYD